jgi:hypothetical protein
MPIKLTLKAPWPEPVASSGGSVASSHSGCATRLASQQASHVAGTCWG